MRVTAVRKGYFGGKIRDAGEGFSIPDALMKDDKLRPSWVEVGEGGRVASAEPETDGEAPTEPRFDARKRGRKPKQAASSVPAETSDQEDPAPIGNGLTEALGGPPPDWLPGDINE